MSCSFISYATEFIEEGVSNHAEKEMLFRAGCVQKDAEADIPTVITICYI